MGNKQCIRNMPAPVSGAYVSRCLLAVMCSASNVYTTHRFPVLVPRDDRRRLSHHVTLEGGHVLVFRVVLVFRSLYDPGRGQRWNIVF